MFCSILAKSSKSLTRFKSIFDENSELCKMFSNLSMKSCEKNFSTDSSFAIWPFSGLMVWQPWSENYFSYFRILSPRDLERIFLLSQFLTNLLVLYPFRCLVRFTLAFSSKCSGSMSSYWIFYLTLRSFFMVLKLLSKSCNFWSVSSSPN